MTKFLLLVLMAGCLRLQPKPAAPLVVDCQGVDNAHIGFDAASMAAMGLSGAGGIVTASYDNANVRVGVGVTTAVLTTIGGVFLWTGNYYSQQYATGGCGNPAPAASK